MAEVAVTIIVLCLTSENMQQSMCSVHQPRKHDEETNMKTRKSPTKNPHRLTTRKPSYRNRNTPRCITSVKRAAEPPPPALQAFQQSIDPKPACNRDFLLFSALFFVFSCSSPKRRDNFSANVSHIYIDPFSTANSFWGLLGTNYLEFEWFVPRTGLEF